jgi:hypothetical protein
MLNTQRCYIQPLSKPNLPITNQFAPAINMVQIRQLDEDSILPILEEDPGAESEGSTKTITDIGPRLGPLHWRKRPTRRIPAQQVEA